ncbi:hypothetical protein [Actinoplanes sp. NPDC023714]|uniref:hypothetical protein n=1 Tax=Actinoplanes sp. NPDC023714 TaxID=3154322 RepID=UPI0033E81177
MGGRRLFGLVVAALSVLPATVAAFPATPASAAVSSRITVSVPAALRTGVTAAVTGKLTPGRNRTVRLERLSGTRRYVLATARTGRDGRYTLKVRPSSSGDWTLRVSAPASGSYRAVTSARRTVRIWTATTATAAFSPAAGTVGKPVALTGRLTPQDSGRAVTAQRWNGRTWVTVARATSAAKGAYRIALPSPAAAGRTSWRVTVAATRHRGAWTGPVQILTTKPAPTTPDVPLNPTNPSPTTAPTPTAPPPTGPTAPPGPTAPTGPTAPIGPTAPTGPTNPTNPSTAVPTPPVTPTTPAPTTPAPTTPAAPFLVAANGPDLHTVEINAPHRTTKVATGEYVASTATGRVLYRDAGLHLTGAGLPPTLLATETATTCLMDETLETTGRYAAWMTGRPVRLNDGTRLCAAGTDVRLHDATTGTTTAITMPRGVPGSSSLDQRAAFTRDGAHLVVADTGHAVYVYTLATGRWTQPPRPGTGTVTIADVPAPAGYVAIDQQVTGCASGRWYLDAAGVAPAVCVASSVAGRRVSPDGTRTLWTATAGAETLVMVGDAAGVRDLGAVAAGTVPRFAGDGAVGWNGEITPLDGAAAWRLPAGWEMK